MNWALVHSPLVGSSTWGPVAAILRARGDRVAVPDLAHVLHEGPPHHGRFAAAVEAQAGTLTPGACVLVVHSGAGALVPAIVACHPERYRAIVFVDAALPHPGRRWTEAAPPERVAGLLARAVAGRLPPWNEWFGADALAALLPDDRQRAQFVEDLPRVPVSWFEEVAPDSTAWRHVPSAYLRLSDAYVEAESQARAGGLRASVLPGDHLAMLTQPARMTEALIDLVEALDDVAD